MRKLKYLLLAIIFLATSFSQSEYVRAANSKSGSVAIPITTGLVGSDNSAKTFYLDLPSGVTSSSIAANTLKYNGTNEKIGNISIENGKIKITLKGTQNSKLLDKVQGYRASYEQMYITNIYNSIWLYSDGRRWQINEYDENNDRMKTKDVNATDGYPSQNPPRTVVTAGPLQDQTYLKWYNGSKTEVIDSADIISSSITPVLFQWSDYVYKKPTIKNGRIIINYYIPNSTPWKSEPDDGLSGKAEGRQYFANIIYYYEAKARVTTYSYGGTVTFDYGLPDEVTLTGSAILEQPNPNPAKFENKNVPVKITVKGELLAYNDSSNIGEWVFYVKEKNNESSLKTKKMYTKTLTANESFSFEIPKVKVTGSSFSQDYDLSVVVRFKKPVVTKTGTITSLKESFSARAGVYTTPNPPGSGFPGPSSPPDPPREMKPPIALINAPSKVKAGQEFEASGAGSYDPDGFIKSYYWDAPGAEGELIDKPRGTIWYDKDHLGEQTIALTVVDDEMMTGSTSKEITVIEPKPDALIRAEGTLKQNRKVIIQSYSSSPKHYPLVASKTKITITAISGGTDADIKYSGSLNGVFSKEALFKKPGQYKATIYVENTLGLSASNETTFEIVPDEKPFAYFTLPGSVYRNPEDGNQATISIDDMSFSPDKDIVARRLWEYRYDSNNNGTFTDEHWVIFNNENLDRLNLKVQEVGQYEVRLTVFEEFGQPTIEEFVTQADRQSISSESTQNVIERIFKVKNQAPDVDWSR
ncbi:hypothetical protein [Paenibacillus durus]|uniref:PKD domain-containing protein n=1 Tax=Paenibacillus durus ATCC 35681 TaxID=1333534 RepID=A0A0F7CHF0_PAEDU|nr:hypothetical protein [Paenibacillus durus]AKG33690.1 hypothetical protein VK70_03065 [Paenibacillus durus ATCC 35681]